MLTIIGGGEGGGIGIGRWRKEIGETREEEV